MIEVESDCLIDPMDSKDTLHSNNGNVPALRRLGFGLIALGLVVQARQEIGLVTCWSIDTIAQLLTKQEREFVQHQLIFLCLEIFLMVLNSYTNSLVSFSMYLFRSYAPFLFGEEIVFSNIKDLLNIYFTILILVCLNHPNLVESIFSY